MITHMEYICKKPGHIDYGCYSLYLDSIRNKLPEHVCAFASNPSHFDLQSHHSLHDAWLESVTVREAASGDRGEIRQLEIHLSLLGAFHDRRIHLHYFGVAQYSFVTPPRYGHPRYRHTAHGDLFTHEVRLGHDGLIVHEIAFERDATMMIECFDLRHSEEMITTAL